jgi:hypothetical protein
MDADEQPGTSRPRWVPERMTITTADVPRERVSEAAPDGGVSPRLLGKANQLQQVVASLVVRRSLIERGIDIVTRMHRSGVMFLESRRAGENQLGFVVPFVSSMEPRPIWPTLVPLGVLDLVPIDWIASCSVPKQPALDAIEERDGFGYLLGWLAADDIAQLPIVTVSSHSGHEFDAKYRQTKNHRLRPFSDFGAGS